MTTEEKWARVQELQEEARMECEASYDHEARAAACRAEAARLQGDDPGGEFYDAIARMYRERFSPDATAAYDAMKARRSAEAARH